MAEQFITNVAGLPKDVQATLAANARSQGMTVEEYLTERGGVNPVTKKYGDSYNPNTDLTDAEYQAAIAGAGSKAGDSGKALNAARDKKLKAYLAANPNSTEAIEARLAAGTQDAFSEGILGTSSTQKTVSKVTKQSDGSSIVTYSDGSTTTLPAGSAVPAVGSKTATSGSLVNDEKQAERQSAYDLLYSQFQQYGLESLVTPLKDLVISGSSPAEFTIKLRETDAYKKRFAANAQRIQKGLTAISEAEYLGLEDQYQNIMRNYGLPAEYYTRGDMGTQEGFNKFIANDVSAAELEDRVMTAQSRVLNANPEVLASLKAFYPDITNGDILAYTLDPTKGLTDIKRKVTAAEIGGAATQAGLGITGTRAGELTAAGITKQQAQQGFQTVAEVAPRGGQLAEIYKQNPYTQTTAEAEVFGLAGSAEAARQRKKLTSLETAAFGGSAGAGAIARDRAGVL
jgi:hypothetical protein